MLLRIGDFHENWCNESHTARVLISFCLHLLHFICFWKRYTIVSYVKIGEVKTAVYLMMWYTSVCTFHIYRVIWVNCGISCLNIMLLAFVSFMKIGTGNTVIFLWLYMRLYLCMYFEPHILKLTNSLVMAVYYVMEYMISKLANHILREWCFSFLSYRIECACSIIPGWYTSSDIGGMVIGRDKLMCSERICPVPVCPPQIPHGLHLCSELAANCLSELECW